MFVPRESNYGGEWMLPVAQQKLEEVLNERAAELGVDFRRRRGSVVREPVLRSSLTNCARTGWSAPTADVR